MLDYIYYKDYIDYGSLQVSQFLVKIPKNGRLFGFIKSEKEVQVIDFRSLIPLLLR